MPCGICGCFGRQDEATVTKMVQAIAHRGPDEQRVASGPGWTLGAARLAIIDPEGGSQPATDGNVTAVLNGELYDHHNEPGCDTTNALLDLWRAADGKPIDFATSLSGMYAVALWDAQRKTGVLVRDRVGKKPLYFYEQPATEGYPGALWFASEIKALLLVPGFDRAVNWEGIEHYLAYRHVPHPKTAWAKVHAVPPAGVLTWDPKYTSKTEAWHLDWSRGVEPPPNIYAPRLLSRLRHAVRIRLRSDAPLGFFLSGGLDSSLVLALAAEAGCSPLRTFTLVYPEGPPGKQADAEAARSLADSYGTEHTEVPLTAHDFVRDLPKIVRAFDEPFAGVLSSYWLSKAARDAGCKVALCGDGADELFGSYASHRYAASLRREHPRDQAQQLRFWPLRFALCEPGMVRDTVRRAAGWIINDHDGVKHYVTTEHGPQSPDLLPHRWFTCPTAPESDPLNRMLEAEFRYLFPGDVLTYADRLSMAHALEVRSPFLDVGVVEYAARIPGWHKIQDGGATKWILKQAAAPMLPPEIIDRPKEGFVSLRDAVWAHEGPLRELIESTLRPERVEHVGILRPRLVEKVLGRLGSGNWKDGRRAFVMLMLMLWAEEYGVRVPT